MRLIRELSLLLSMAPLAFSTCLSATGDYTGAAAPPGTATQATDMNTLQNLEFDDSIIRLSSVEVCLDNDAILSSIQATAVSVPLDGSPVTTQPLSIFGADNAQYCESLTLDYENGEYLKGIHGYYTQYILRRIVLTTNKSSNTLDRGNSEVSGIQGNRLLSFSEDDQPVGLFGTEGVSKFMQIGAITTLRQCANGETIVIDTDDSSNSSNTSSEPEMDQTTLIVAIVVPVVVVLLAGIGVAIWCVMKKQQQNREKTGVEVVSVHKTRPQTPPKDAKKIEERVQNLTDEEDVPQGDQARQNSQGANDDQKSHEYVKKQSAIDKPDVQA